MDYTSQNYIIISFYNAKSLDSKSSVNYVLGSSGNTGKPTQLVSSLNTGISRGT